MIWQIGAQGKYRWWKWWEPSWFQQAWCITKIPWERWFQGAYVWIGFTTDRGVFMQIGFLPQRENNTVGNSRFPGEYAVFYSTSRLKYFLQAENNLKIKPGDELLFNIERTNPYTGEWGLGAVNLTTAEPVVSHVVEDAGSKFHLTTFKAVFEGYPKTEALHQGALSLEAMLQDLKGVPRPAPLRPYGAYGLSIGGRPFGPAPTWIDAEVHGPTVVFKGRPP